VVRPSKRTTECFLISWSAAGEKDGFEVGGLLPVDSRLKIMSHPDEIHEKPHNCLCLQIFEPNILFGPFHIQKNCSLPGDYPAMSTAICYHFRESLNFRSCFRSSHEILSSCWLLRQPSGSRLRQKKILIWYEDEPTWMYSHGRVSRVNRFAAYKATRRFCVSDQLLGGMDDLHLVDHPLEGRRKTLVSFSRVSNDGIASNIRRC
jgi:hypothetical protein